MTRDPVIMGIMTAVIKTADALPECLLANLLNFIAHKPQGLDLEAVHRLVF
jgi:hypothetical protein